MTEESALRADAQSGLWCHDIPDIAIPAEPTKDDAERALRKLSGLFRTFPFADAARLSDPDLDVEVVDLTKPAGLDESSFLAALLTAVCRQSLDLAPGFLCDAPNFSGASTGKGLVVKAICIIASGVRPSAFTSGHDAEEFDKRLTSALTEAHPAVFLDNFNSKDLSSDILASVLTENRAMVRPMGHTKTVPLHTRTFIGITGNSVQIAEEMARRLSTRTSMRTWRTRSSASSPPASRLRLRRARQPGHRRAHDLAMGPPEQPQARPLAFSRNPLVPLRRPAIIHCRLQAAGVRCGLQRPFSATVRPPRARAVGADMATS